MNDHLDQLGRAASEIEEESKELERGQIRKVNPDDDSVLNSDAEQSQSSFQTQETQEGPSGSAATQNDEEEKKGEGDDLP